MDNLKQVEQEMQELDFQSLASMKTDEKVLSSIDYTRPLSEYGTAEQISTFLKLRSGSQHVYTDSLNVNGKAVQDSMDKYLGASDFYSSGALKEAFKSPLHLFYAKESGWRDELSKYQKNRKHFDLGTFLHMAVLEPTRFKRATVEPNLSLASRDGVNGLIRFWENKISISGIAYVSGEPVQSQQGFNAAKLAVREMGLSLDKQDGKKAYYNILKDISGFEAVSEEHKTIIDIAFQNYKRYAGGMLFDLVKHSKREISLYYTDPESGLKVRVRPDALQFEENIGCNAIISVKTTRAESISHYAWQSAQLNYELSEGMYLDVASGVTGRDFRAVIMIMVQTVPPFGVAALVWDPEDIEIGRYKYRMALQTALECEEAGKYPGYDAFAEEGHLGLIQFKQPSWNGKDLMPTNLND